MSGPIILKKKSLDFCSAMSIIQHDKTTGIVNIIHMPSDQEIGSFLQYFSLLKARFSLQ